MHTNTVPVPFSKEGLRLGGSLAQFDRHGTPVDPSGCGYLWCLLAETIINEHSKGVILNKVGFRNFPGFRNLDSETFSLDSETFSLDSETLSSETFCGRIQKLFSLDSETFFVGFRNFFRWIQKLFSLDSETFFVGFRNFFRWIQKLFSSDSETFFVGFRNFFRWIQKLFSLDSETFFVGFRDFFFRGFTTPTHGRCHTRPGPRVGWGGVG